MHRRKLVSLLAAGLAGEVIFTNQASASEIKYKSALLADQGGPDGLVWKITGGKVTHFFAASLHALRAVDHPLPEAYLYAYRQTRQVYFEANPHDGLTPEQRAFFFEKALYPKGITLKSILPAASWVKMMAFLDEQRIPLGDITQARPWYAAMRLREQILIRYGFQKKYGVEATFFTKAIGERKPVGGLSRFEDQLERQVRLGEKEGMEELIELIGLLRDIGKTAIRVASAWSAGDLETLGRMLPPTEDILQTNKNWKRTLSALLSQSETPTLVVMGASHFAGPQAVQNLIREI